MTAGETGETCGGGGGGGGNAKRSRSVTALSTIAIQAGQSLLVVSVLESGSLVHLQLVQVHPGLCEIGSNQEQNQTLIQEQQQLMEKLKKHEREVLSVVDKNRRAEPRRRRDDGVMKRNKKQEEEEEVYKAMVASLKEAWTLLLRLLQRRQEVLTLTAEFYRRALEFAGSIDRVEDLQIRRDVDRLTYDSMRRDLLGKSLQVLSSSSVLLQKLRRLQKTEALQRRGGVLQEEEQEEEEEEESSQRSGGVASRLEELVETLQDRRRRADQAVWLQLQQAEDAIVVRKTEESREAGSEDWSLTVNKILDQNLQSGSTLAEGTNLKSDLRTKDTRDLQPGSRSDLKPGSRSEETTDLQLESRSDLQSGYRSDLQPRFKLDQTRDLNPGSKSGETIDLQPGSRSDLKTDSKSVETRDLLPGFNLGQTPRWLLDLKPGSKLDVKPGSRSEETRKFNSGSRSDLKPESRSDLKPESKSEETRDLQSGSGSEETGDLQSGSGSEESGDLQSGSGSEESGDLQSGSGSEETGDLQSGSGSEETGDLQSGSGSEETGDLQSGSGSEETGDLQSGSGSEVEDLRLSEPEQLRAQTAAATSSGQAAGLETQSREDPAHQALLTNQRRQLLTSCERLVDKIWSWVQQGSTVLSNSSEAGRQLFEAEDTLNTHLQLHTQAESAGRDAENMKQILDQIQALLPDSTSRTSPWPPIEPSGQLSTLKALTEQLKRGTRTSAARPSPPAADPTGSLSPELDGRVDLVLKELQSLNRKIDSNLQLLQPYVTLLRMAQQVEEEMEELRDIYRRRPEEEEDEESEAGSNNIRTTTSSRSPVKKKKQVDAYWQQTQQRILTAQQLGNHYVHTVATVSGAGLNLQSVVSVVQQTVERLSRTKQEVNELQSQQQEYCRKYRERLLKTLQDLNCVSELLDSCTLMDLDSDLQTSRLLEHFSQAGPHFIQLDTEVEYMEKSWETLRRVQDKLEVKEVKEEDLSELLKLQERVKNKIHQSELILDLTSSFHLTSKQLEALLRSYPASPLTGSDGSCGEAELSRHREAQQQIQSLFTATSNLKTDICTAVSNSAWTCFRVEQLEARLLALDSLCVSWLKEAARQEHNLCGELTTRQLNDDISQIFQVRGSFKELKKRFSNLKFNYQKRNDRTRNMKAVRNQLQQVELYEEKLQVLRKRLQGVTARLGSEVKDGGVAREAEDAVNELQRQMGEFERSVQDHQKTLDMTCRLQEAMEEYQFWCKEASATIARVGKFSSECRSTEAVSVLYRQFEKFVWPTVPQQEERIGQISELAVRLHGVEEGRRYIEKTVSKHSEMVESIRELSNGLMELEAKLKQQNGEREIKEEEETERRRENETEEKDEEKEKKENRKMKQKEQTDNRRTQEAADMYELKETGNTPELTTEHDGKEVPVKRQTAANRKPPLQKSRSQEADSSHRQQLTSSYCSTHTFSLSCCPMEANRRVNTIHNQLQPVSTEPQATPPPSVIGPSFSDIQREFQGKEQGHQAFFAPCGLNVTPLQDAPAGGLSEAELQQQEVMSEDSLSNDEYDCASPDDISLPPLAETPESNMVQSDFEEGFCFSSHSVHIRQHRESSRTESCQMPPIGLHSSTRFRSESGSLVQSPLTVTLCSIPRTGEISTNVPHTPDLSLGGPDPSFASGSDPVYKSNTPDNCSNKDHDVPGKGNLSQTEPVLKEHNNQYNWPQLSTGTQGKITQNVASKGDTLPQTDPIPQAAELNQSPTLPQLSVQPFNGPDLNLHKDNTPSRDTRFLKCSTTFPQIRTTNSFSQSVADSESGLHQDINSSQTRKETTPVSKPQRDSLTNTSTTTHRTIYLQSSPSDSQRTSAKASSVSSPHERPLSQSKTLPQINPVPQPRGFAQSPSLTDSALHKDKTLPDIGLLKSYAICPQTSTTLLQDSNLPQSYPDSRSGLDQDVLSSKISKETSSASMPQSSSLTTTTTVTQQTVYCQSLPPNSHCNVPKASSNLRSQKESPFSRGGGGLPEVHAPIPPVPNSVRNFSTSSSTSNRLSSKQSHQTVYSLHESLTSSCTQQCVHDPGMTPSSSAKPTAPPQPEAQTQALAQQANPHVNLFSSPSHLLTPDQDPNICQPIAIREEIRLTPQIQWPPLPAPPPLPEDQIESLPQGKASKSGTPSFTRPLSRATVMEGSPVTLEVEVTGHPEPALTWFKDGEVSSTGPDRTPACEDGKHFLFIPEVLDTDGGLNEARAANCHDPRQAAGNSCSSGDEWLDILSVDWQTWFGTLCVLLWLLYLIVL